MKYEDDKLKTAHEREIRICRNKHYNSMACGAKKPSEEARKWFRRPAYFVEKSDESDAYSQQ